MSGTHLQLAECAASFASQHLKEIVRDVIIFMLDNQCVDYDIMTNAVAKVVCGAGQGLNMSGEIADAAFIRLCEEPYIGSQERGRQMA